MTPHRSQSERRSEALRLLDAYGARREAWPALAASLHDEARDDPGLSAAFADAGLLDEALVAPEFHANGALKGRILADFAAQSARAARWLRFGFRKLLPAGALAGVAGFGFALGAATAGEPAYDEAEAALAQATGDADLWSEYGR